MEIIFELNQVPNCPACNKQLEGGDFIAKDFVICNEKGYPRGNSATFPCNCCNEILVATPSADKMTITFSSR